MRATARGVVDFRRARPQDPSWHRYVNAVISKMAADDELEVTKAILAYQCALVGNGQLTDDSFKAATKNCHELLQEVAYAVQPWTRRDPKEAEKERIGSLIDAYKRLVGDPSTPEFQARMAAEAVAHRERMQQVPAETEDARVDRLAANRDKTFWNKKLGR